MSKINYTQTMICLQSFGCTLFLIYFSYLFNLIVAVYVRMHLSDVYIFVT